MKNISITIINDTNTLTFDELCRATNAENSLILQLIDYHIIQPIGNSQTNWQFDHISLRRARIASNFYYDLEVNLAGIGLLIDLLEQMDDMKKNQR